MKISLSIVTFNSASDIGSLLDSLEASQTHQLLSEIFIIDNASTDITRDIVRTFQEKLKNLRLLDNPTNRGFGLAHNQAISKADSTYHVICNPDIRFRDNSLKELISFFESHQEIGLVAPKVVFPDGETQLLNRRFPTLLDLAVQRLGKCLPASLRESRTTRYLMKDCDYSKELDVPCLSGCFLVGRTPLLKSIGGFDSNYFLYFEDFDLCQKIQKADFRTVYSPLATVEHRWARNSHKKWLHTWYFVASAFMFFNRWGWRIF